MAELQLPAPLLREISRPYWEALTRGELCLQNCASCARWIFYPRSFCPYCGALDPIWLQASGDVALYSWTIAVAPAMRSLGTHLPLAIGIAQLVEGPRIPALLAIAHDQLAVGLPLKPVFDRASDGGLPRLRFAAA